VCVVGRRLDKLTEVVEECRIRGTQTAKWTGASRILGIAGDYADVNDMVRLRMTLETGMYIYARLYSPQRVLIVKLQSGKAWTP